MQASPTPVSPAPDAANVPAAARCADHPEAPATGTCFRCGRFFCAQDAKPLFGRTFCTTCAARPDVDYLEAFRLKYWGKRDIWAWLFGIGSALNVINAAGLLMNPATVLLGVSAAFNAATGIAFFLGVRPA